MRKTIVAVLVASLGALSHTARSAPRLVQPVEIEDTADPWVLQISVDAARVPGIAATRVLRDGVRVLERKQVPLAVPDAAAVAADRVRISLPVGRESLRRLADGVYATRVVVDTAAPTSGDAPYRAQRTVYVRVRQGSVERIDMRAYSRIVEPTHLERDAEGHAVSVHAGTVAPGTGAQGLQPVFDRQLSSADRGTGARPVLTETQED